MGSVASDFHAIARYLATRKRSIETFLIAALLLAVALVVRLRQIHVDLYGDESLYFYLSKTWGGAPASAPEMPHLFQHVAARPFMYVFNHPWANLGFFTFRAVNICIGSMVPVFMFFLSRRFGAGSMISAAVAVLAALHPDLVAIASVGFPDTQATALVLASYLLFFSNRLKWSALALTLAVLTKEAYAMFALGLLAIGMVKFLRGQRRPIVVPIVAMVTVVLSNGIAIVVFHGSPQGWSPNALNGEFLEKILFTAWFAPFLLVLRVHRKYALIALGLGPPFFFLVWGYVFHRGVEWWYTTGPITVALIVVAVALQHSISNLARLIVEPAWMRESVYDVPVFVAVSASALCLYTVVAAPRGSGWPRLSARSILTPIVQPAPQENSGATFAVVSFLEEQDHIESLVLIDTFWAYPYFPFGSLAEKVQYLNLGGQQVQNAFQRLQRTSDGPPLVVWQTPVREEFRRFQRPLASCEVFKNHGYRVYRMSRQCLRTLAE